MSSARRRSRQFALQAIYQWQLNPLTSQEIEQQFEAEHDLAKCDQAYFNELLHGVIKHVAEVDEKITPTLDRDITALNPVELSVLRLATYEFIYQLSVPYRVVINEALELAKTFGAEEGYKYVNGVLDKLAKTLRAAEQ